MLVSSKKKSKKIIFTKKNFKLIKTLFKVGAISHFTVLNINLKPKFFAKNHVKTYIKFTVFFFKSTPFFKNIRQVSTPSKKFTITVETLKLITPIFKTSVFILSTPFGILTNKEALRLKTGGQILFMLN